MDFALATNLPINVYDLEEPPIHEYLFHSHNLSSLLLPSMLNDMAQKILSCDTLESIQNGTEDDIHDGDLTQTA